MTGYTTPPDSHGTDFAKSIPPKMSTAAATRLEIASPDRERLKHTYDPEFMTQNCRKYGSYFVGEACSFTPVSSFSSSEQPVQTDTFHPSSVVSSTFSVFSTAPKYLQ